MLTSLVPLSPMPPFSSPLLPSPRPLHSSPLPPHTLSPEHQIFEILPLDVIVRSAAPMAFERFPSELQEQLTVARFF